VEPYLTIKDKLLINEKYMVTYINKLSKQRKKKTEYAII